MRSTKEQNKNKFMRIITVPIRALSKAKDFYVRSMTDVAERVSYGNTMGGPGGQFSSSLPKSFSSRSTSGSSEASGDDFSELIRAASARSYGTRIDVDAILKEQQLKRSATTTTMGSKAVLPKCSSVAMGRIDEDGPADFDEHAAGDVKPDLFYPRSRSYAVTKRSVAF
ncbi:hypothetical protein PRUPE_1G420800 [Prunus persica]|uniref:Uncharacterized protein n=1 Tax=Prunus persica TaxID=3760 RepID=M5XZP9_PRUPE|nr:uncharacterized protein LOC18790477 [Prunus persica]ONI33382.1 hypothetical protein PRUPE_1G420800 [Prunus persica]